MKVLFLGESQIRFLSKLYGESGHEVRVQRGRGKLSKLLTLPDLLWADVVYHVYGTDINRLALLRVAKLLRKKIILHWIGTDVLEAAEIFRKEGRVLNAGYPHVDLAVAEHLCQELNQIGIEAKEVPIIPVGLEFEVLPMPENHGVLSYIPESRQDFYGIDLLRKMARRFPEVPFYVVANTGAQDPADLPNVHYTGLLCWEELRRVYEKCSVLLRYPRHDGLPVMVLEALGMGRQVICRYPFPFTHTPAGDSPEEIAAELGKILALPPAVNQEGAAYVRKQYNEKNLLRLYQDMGLI